MMHSAPSLERLEAQAFRRQQSAFSLLTLFVLAVLLLLHTLFASLLGEPSPAVVLLLGLSFSLKLDDRCADSGIERSRSRPSHVSVGNL